MASSDSRRLSVSLVDVNAGHESEFHALATQFEALLVRKEYGRAEMIRDEAQPLRFYAVRHWPDVAAAERCHGDPEVQALTARLYQIARVTHVVNGVQAVGPDAPAARRSPRARRGRSPHRLRSPRRGTSAARPAPSGGAAAIGGSARAACAIVPARSIWSAPRAARASTPTPRSRISRSAPRSRPPTATSSPAATSRTRPTA